MESIESIESVEKQLEKLNDIKDKLKLDELKPDNVIDFAINLITNPKIMKDYLKVLEETKKELLKYQKEQEQKKK